MEDEGQSVRLEIEKLMENNCPFPGSRGKGQIEVHLTLNFATEQS